MKKLSLKTITAFCVLALNLASCHKEATYLNADQQEVSTSIKGETVRIGLHSDGIDYSITHTPEWATAEIADSMLTITIGTNETGAERKDSVVITCSGQLLCLPLSQSSVATFMNVKSEGVTFENKGGEEKVGIETDGREVVAEGLPNGVTASYANGVMVLKAEANNGRTINAAVELKADTITVKLPITIKGSICPTCKGTGKVKCKSCGGEGILYSDWSGSWPCETCGGYLLGECKYDGIEYGSGKVRCRRCGGSGIGN